MEHTAEKIVNTLMEQDAYSQWLGIRVISIQPGQMHLQMQVTPAMCNGFGFAHGGIAFALCDSGCSFAVNGHGRKAMSVDTSINQFKSAQPGDVLNCYVKEVSLGKKLGVYYAEVVNQDEVTIAMYKGTYYRSDKKWFEDTETDTTPLQTRMV